MRLLLRYQSLVLLLLPVGLVSQIFITALVCLLIACLPAVAQTQRASNFKPSNLPNHLEAPEQKFLLAVTS